MNNKIFTLIEKSATDKDSMLELLKIFEPLLKRYAYKLSYEDAYNDLQLFMIELIRKLNKKNLNKTEDKFYLSYIKRSIEHKYIELSGKLNNTNKYSFNYYASDIEFEDLLDNNNVELDDYSLLLLNDLRQALTQNEYEIIYLLFYKNYSVAEIAAKKQMSRQYINNCKLKALKKLKLYFSDS